MDQKHLWTWEEAEAKIREWYEDLRVKYNDPDRRKEIKDKYNDDSLVYARASQKPRVDKRAALRHWKEAFARFDVITEPIVVKLTSLVPPGAGIPSRNIAGTGNQKATWNGSITFRLKGKMEIESFSFEGEGWHIDPCYFGNPDYESYPW